MAELFWCWKRRKQSSNKKKRKHAYTKNLAGDIRKNNFLKSSQLVEKQKSNSEKKNN